jgi:hypothetical protein
MKEAKIRKSRNQELKAKVSSCPKRFAARFIAQTQG